MVALCGVDIDLCVLDWVVDIQVTKWDKSSVALLDNERTLVGVLDMLCNFGSWDILDSRICV